MSIETEEARAAMERVGALDAIAARALRRTAATGRPLRAIEPMIGLGRPELELRDDGWTIATADGSLSAHVEHTVVVGAGGGRVLTA
jgi:hypothetical protein